MVRQVTAISKATNSIDRWFLYQIQRHCYARKATEMEHDLETLRNHRSAEGSQANGLLR
ncbi:MAG: hypothetical protein NVV59_15525 [Chitinophagaceae bacterium]|nr:hypothetical protein [Chitinophagaceae bacterium]